MSAPPKNVDEYLAAVPREARATLEAVRKAVRAAAPNATEVISYQMPTFRYHGALVAFAAFTSHCSLFPMSKSVLVTFNDELAAYDTARTKGTIRFPLDKPLPAALVKKIVKARMRENEARAKK